MSIPCYQRKDLRLVCVILLFVLAVPKGRTHFRDCSAPQRSINSMRQVHGEARIRRHSYLPEPNRG